VRPSSTHPQAGASRLPAPRVATIDNAGRGGAGGPYPRVSEELESGGRARRVRRVHARGRRRGPRARARQLGRPGSHSGAPRRWCGVQRRQAPILIYLCGRTGPGRLAHAEVDKRGIKYLSVHAVAGTIFAQLSTSPSFVQPALIRSSSASTALTAGVIAAIAASAVATPAAVCAVLCIYHWRRRQRRSHVIDAFAEPSVPYTALHAVASVVRATLQGTGTLRIDG
jgi:hypothetical protein